MLHSYVYKPIIFKILFLLSFTNSGTIDIVTVYSCEHSRKYQAGQQNALLHCDQGFVIRVISATYGKPTKNQCVNEDPKFDYQRNLTCGTANHTANVKDKCNGEEYCTYHGRNQVAGDPCAGAHKHTAIKYYCVEN